MLCTLITNKRAQLAQGRGHMAAWLPEKTCSAFFFRFASFSLISLQSFFAVRFFDTCEPRFAPFAIKSNDAGIVKLRIAFSIVVKVYAAYTH